MRPVSAERFERTIAAIDAVNAEDPNRIVVRGEERPKELAHAELMTEWVTRMRPDASDEQLIAARAHHIKRWAMPRSDYPDGRTGYLRWRTALKELHAELVGKAMAKEGYPPDWIQRVQDIIRKKDLGRDPDVQVHEDALCLVFIETQFTELAARLHEEKMVDVVRKVLNKMSDQGRELALALDLPQDDLAIISRAMS
jgi:hypothetical protein